MVSRIVKSLSAIAVLALLGAEVAPSAGAPPPAGDIGLRPQPSEASATPASPPSVSPNTPAATDEDSEDDTASDPTAEPQKPIAPVLPARSQTAVLEVLDKVTASTLRFGAPIGRPVQYKSLVFTVKTCQTRDADGVRPQPAAYVVITSLATREPTEVFKGWIFAESPSLNGLQHPIYDAWLVACSAAAPVS